MSATIRKVRNGLLAVSMLGVLGFGAREALAAPAEQEKAAACNPAACDRACKAQYGPFAGGFCDPFGGCSCAV